MGDAKGGLYIWIKGPIFVNSERGLPCLLNDIKNELTLKWKSQKFYRLNYFISSGTLDNRGIRLLFVKKLHPKLM